MEEEYLLTLPPGATLGNYAVERLLGQGGFGITYLARHVKLGRPAAIKEYFPGDLALRQGDLVRSRAAQLEPPYNLGRTRFLEEARILARIQHPNIVRVTDFFEVNGTAYIVMDYEEGESYTDLLRRRKTVDEKTLLDIALPLLSGLATLHGAGIIHRDIKPANIYLREDGSPVLLDFGAARQAIGIQTKTLTAMLTPGYAPIEQYYSKSDRQGPWTDLYALAAVLYRSVTGKLPPESILRSDSLLRQEADPLKPAAVVAAAHYSAAFLTAIDRGLEVLEKARYRTAHEFANALVGLATDAEGFPTLKSVSAAASAVETATPIAAGEARLQVGGDKVALAAKGAAPPPPAPAVVEDDYSGPVWAQGNTLRAVAQGEMARTIAKQQQQAQPKPKVAPPPPPQAPTPPRPNPLAGVGAALAGLPWGRLAKWGIVLGGLGGGGFYVYQNPSALGVGWRYFHEAYSYVSGLAGMGGPAQTVRVERGGQGVRAERGGQSYRGDDKDPLPPGLSSSRQGPGHNECRALSLRIDKGIVTGTLDKEAERLYNEKHCR
jgi:serine/threonine protein kinase